MCPRGLWCHPAKVVCVVFRTGGSNPPAGVKKERHWSVFKMCAQKKERRYENMKIEKIEKNQFSIAHIESDGKIITDTQSALDLIMTVRYETGAERIVLNKAAVTEDFFILSSGVAGEILQKLINYHVKLAIYGDYTKYTSKPLRDFIYESNNGKDIFFVATKEEAVDKLGACEWNAV